MIGVVAGTDVLKMLYYWVGLGALLSPETMPRPAVEMMSLSSNNECIFSFGLLEVKVSQFEVAARENL